MNIPPASEEKFKMTFKNSWWQCLFALLLIKPFQVVIAFLLIFAVSFFDLPDTAELGTDMVAVANIGALALSAWLAYYLSYRGWKNDRTKKANQKE